MDRSCSPSSPNGIPEYCQDTYAVFHQVGLRVVDRVLAGKVGGPASGRHSVPAAEGVKKAVGIGGAFMFAVLVFCQVLVPEVPPFCVVPVVDGQRRDGQAGHDLNTGGTGTGCQGSCMPPIRCFTPCITKQHQ